MKSDLAAQRAFEKLKPELVRTDPGRFAVLCGGRLLGVFETVDEALLASSVAFDSGELTEGESVFITEIAENAALRVTAWPYPKTNGREAPVLSGELRI
jgi:hypothetical protein